MVAGLRQRAFDSLSLLTDAVLSARRLQFVARLCAMRASLATGSLTTLCVCFSGAVHLFTLWTLWWWWWWWRLLWNSTAARRKAEAKAAARERASKRLKYAFRLEEGLTRQVTPS